MPNLSYNDTELKHCQIYEVIQHRDRYMYNYWQTAIVLTSD